ncbi:D-alanyl-D-alanine carboxypeptidase, partial [Elusimicrobiota bacterium]
MKILKALTIFFNLILICTVVSAQKLNDDIHDFLREKQDLYKNAKIGLKIINLKDNSVLCSINEDVSLTPASVMKIVTTYACLKKLGKEYLTKTPVFLDSKIKHDGVYHGNIYLKGKGDPCLNTGDIKKACITLADIGIKHVEGNIVYDTSEFDEEKLRYFPNARDRYAASSALTVNYNAVKLMLIDKPEIKLKPQPETEYVKLHYEIELENSNKPSKPEMLIEPKESYDYYTIKGVVTNWTKAIDYLAIAVSRPGLYFATLFKENLEKNDVSV